jgi:hypothetical protein
VSRISVNLNRSLEQAIEESGKTPRELIELGLDSLAEQGERVTEAERVAYSRPKTGDCTHPKGRRSKGGLCMACGTNVS